MILGLVATIGLMLAVEAGAAATPAAPPPEPTPAPKAEILGLWKGTSVCAKVSGNEFCNDETVVYNFVDVPSRPATVALKAARIVDGTMIRTYDLYFTYQPEMRQWSCEFDREKVRAVWTYVISEDGLTGNAALLPEHTVVRTVTAKRTSKDQVLAR